MKKILLLSILSSIPLQGDALEFLGHSDKTQNRKMNFFSNLTINNYELNDGSNISLTAPEVGGDYFISHQFSLTGSYFFSTSASFDYEVNGLDFGSKYYFLNPGYQFEASILNSMIATTTEFSPYIYIGYSSRRFQFSKYSISFQGARAGAGIDWHLTGDFFLRGSASVQKLSNSTQGDMSNTSFEFGIGYSF